MSVKILSVDDSKTIRIIIGRSFNKYDCEIHEAANGAEGLTVAASVKPDVIILDYTMPIMDGGEMLTKLKADPVLKSIPVVMLTAEAGKDTVLKIAKLGVRDYVIKPFKEDVIVDKVNRIVKLEYRTEGASTSPESNNGNNSIQVLVVDDKPTF